MFGSSFKSNSIESKKILLLPKSIQASRIDFGRSENFLLSVRIIFKGITKYKSLYLKINSNKINLFRINSIKTELNTLYVS